MDDPRVLLAAKALTSAHPNERASIPVETESKKQRIAADTEIHGFAFAALVPATQGVKVVQVHTFLLEKAHFFADVIWKKRHRFIRQAREHNFPFLFAGVNCDALRPRSKNSS